MTANKVSEKLIESAISPIVNIYVDLAYLRYIALGKLLSGSDPKNDVHSAIISHLESPDFINRVTDNPSQVFNNHDDILAFFSAVSIERPSDDIVILNSPPFDSIDELSQVIVAAKSTNIRAGEDAPISLTINTGDLCHMSAKMTEHLSGVYGERLSVNVSVESIRIDKYPHDRILRFDAFFLQELHDFNENFLTMLDARKFYEKCIYARMVLPPDFMDSPASTEADMTAMFTTIYAVMQCASKFKYARTPRCIIGPSSNR